MGIQLPQATAIGPVCGMTVEFPDALEKGLHGRGPGLRLLRPRMQARLRRGPRALPRPLVPAHVTGAGRVVSGGLVGPKERKEIRCT